MHNVKFYSMPKFYFSLILLIALYLEINHTHLKYTGGGISVIIEQALLKELRAEAKSPCSVLKT